MKYVALFEKEKHGFGVSFPDFPECSTFGDDLDEAVDQAHEALTLFVELFLESGKPLPTPESKKEIMAKPDNKGKKAIFIEIEGDGSDFEEVELVMHSHLLKRIEKYSKQHGISPADFFAIAARETLKNDPLSS